MKKWKTIKRDIELILKLRTHKERIKKAMFLGYSVQKNVTTMGPGGTGLIRRFSRLNITRIQIGCNYGGYAPCVILPIILKKECGNFIQNQKNPDRL